MTPAEACTSLKLGMDLHAVWCKEPGCVALSPEAKVALLALSAAELVAAGLGGALPPIEETPAGVEEVVVDEIVERLKQRMVAEGLCEPDDFENPPAQPVASVERERAEQPRGLTFADLRAVNVPRCVNDFGHALSSWSIAEWMCAALGEGGEAANIAKKMLRHRDGVAGNKGDDRDLSYLREKLGREISDALIYLDLAAASQGIDLAAAVVDTFNRKSEEIGSPLRLAPSPAPASVTVDEYHNHTPDCLCFREPRR